MRWTALALGVATLLIAPDAIAQNRQTLHLWRLCEDRHSQFPESISVASCTQLIEEQRAQGEMQRTAYFHRGMAQLAASNYADAAIDFDTILSTVPNNGDVLALRAFANGMLGEEAESTADFQRSIELNPSRSIAYRLRARLRFAQGRIDEALADSARAREIDPLDIVASLDFCGFRARSGRDLENARSSCDRAVRYLGGLAGAQARMWRGLLNLREGRLQAAWDDYARAYQEAPTLTGSLYGRGVAAIRLGRANRGHADIQRATQIDPHVAATFEAYGIHP